MLALAVVCEVVGGTDWRNARVLVKLRCNGFRVGWVPWRVWCLAQVVACVGLAIVLVFVCRG